MRRVTFCEGCLGGGLLKHSETYYYQYGKIFCALQAKKMPGRSASTRNWSESV